MVKKEEIERFPGQKNGSGIGKNKNQKGQKDGLGAWGKGRFGGQKREGGVTNLYI